MIKIEKINDKKLEELKQHKINKKTAESNIFIFESDNKKQVLKIFKDKSKIDNKIKKINLMNERIPNSFKIAKAESLIEYSGTIIGYTMPYIEGKIYSSLNYSKKDRILILKQISSKLKELHKLGIVCNDFPENIIIDKNKNIYFIDYDNFKVDDLDIDVENKLLKEYKTSIKNIDEKFDDYILNLYTLSSINNISIWYTANSYFFNPKLYYFKDKEITEIAKNTFKLSSEYNEDLIVNKINCKKDLKKIRHRIF